MTHFDFFKQATPDAITAGDEIALFAGNDDFLTSGRYVVLSLGTDAQGFICAVLAGMGPIEGTVCEFPLDAHE